MSGLGLYGVLGVHEDASTADIRRAFRAVARTCHPDLAGHDPEKAARFREARNAYEILTNPARRAEHDRTLEGGPDRRHDRGDFFDSFWRRSAGKKEAGGYEDFDRTPAPPGGGRNEPVRGEDVDVDVDVPESVARSGGRVRVRYMRLRKMASWSADDPAAGTQPSTEQRDLEIPAGVRTFQTRRYPGLGDAGRWGGSYGDLVAHLKVVPDEVEPEPARRTVNVSFAEAALGASISLVTPQGRVRLVVPPHSSSGTQLRLRGKGAAPGRPTRDLLVEIRIVVPESLEGETRRLVEELSGWLPKPPRGND